MTLNTKLKKPSWLRATAPNSIEYKETLELMRKLKLHTVCEEAACPNIAECWKQKQATVLIMGDTCTRNCRFCNVKTGKPTVLDADEPNHIAVAVKELGLKHVVITSVTRDDLADGGAGHFVECIEAIRATSPNTTIEILTPDFKHKNNALETVVKVKPDVFNHNLETVQRLSGQIRSKADYEYSLGVLKRIKELNADMITKSGIMVGLGETQDEVLETMADLRAVGVDFITIGQYLQPTKNQVAVARYVTPEEFDFYRDKAKEMGFSMVVSSPLARSSYYAGDGMEF